MKITFRCTWPNCPRSAPNPLKSLRCRLHQRMAELMRKPAEKRS